MERDEAFREYVDRSWPGLVRTARLLGSGSDAEDLTQSALLKAYLGWERVSRAGNVDAYVYRILVNTRISSLRRRSSGEVLTAASPEVATSDASSQIAMADLVMRALQTLSADHRAVIVLRYYADLTEPQVADVLGLPLGTVKSRLHRAQAHLEQNTNLLDAFEGETR